VWARQIRQLHMTIPRSSFMCVVCARQGGPRGAVTCSTPNLFFLAVFADFAIFSSLLKIIPVLGIMVLVSTKYLKTLYILYSEW
jgi:hypothetical protein